MQKPTSKLAHLSINLRKNLPDRHVGWRYLDNGYFLNSRGIRTAYVLYRVVFHGLDLEKRFGPDYCRTTRIALEVMIEDNHTTVNYYFTQHGLKYLLDKQTTELTDLHYLYVLDFINHTLNQPIDHYIRQAFNRNLHDHAYNEATRYLILCSNRHIDEKSTIPIKRGLVFPHHLHNDVLRERYCMGEIS